MMIFQNVSLATKQGKLSKRPGKVLGVTIHTTGAGPWTRAQKIGGTADAWLEACETYSNRVIYSPHYVVSGDSGAVAQMDADDVQCWHVGSKGSWRYKLPGWAPSVAWWNLRWPGLSSPRDLLGGALWTQGSANALTIGIEVTPPREGPRDPWRQCTWTALADLLSLLSERHGFPMRRDHVITHSDAHPLARSTKGRPWDPGPAQWNPEKAYRLLGVQ